MPPGDLSSKAAAAELKKEIMAARVGRPAEGDARNSVSRSSDGGNRGDRVSASFVDISSRGEARVGETGRKNEREARKGWKSDSRACDDKSLMGWFPSLEENQTRMRC